MSKEHEVLDYICDYMEIEPSSVQLESNIVQLLESTSLHEDDMKFFMLNFLDKFKIYTKERDVSLNYPFVYKSKWLAPLRPLARLLNIFTEEWVDFSDYTVRDLIDFANRGYLHR